MTPKKADSLYGLAGLEGCPHKPVEDSALIGFGAFLVVDICSLCGGIVPRECVFAAGRVGDGELVHFDCAPEDALGRCMCPTVYVQWGDPPRSSRPSVIVCVSCGKSFLDRLENV